MLTSNLWVDMGLVNGAMGTIKAICYHIGAAPPDLPVAVTVHYDVYSGPTLPDGTVPITPLCRTWSSSTTQCSRLQLPLKLAWAATIHKAQALTMDKVVVDIGKKEFSSGPTFVACSCVHHLTDILLDPPFYLQCLTNLSNSHQLEDSRLNLLEKSTFLDLHSFANSSLLHIIVTPSPPPMDSSLTPNPPPMDCPLTPSPPHSIPSSDGLFLHSNTSSDGPSSYSISACDELSSHSISTSNGLPLIPSPPPMDYHERPSPFCITSVL